MGSPKVMGLAKVLLRTVLSLGTHTGESIKLGDALFPFMGS